MPPGRPRKEHIKPQLLRKRELREQKKDPNAPPPRIGRPPKPIDQLSKQGLRKRLERLEKERAAIVIMKWLNSLFPESDEDKAARHLECLVQQKNTQLSINQCNSIRRSTEASVAEKLSEAALLREAGDKADSFKVDKLDKQIEKAEELLRQLTPGKAKRPESVETAKPSPARKSSARKSARKTKPKVPDFKSMSKEELWACLTEDSIKELSREDMAAALMGCFHTGLLADTKSRKKVNKLSFGVLRAFCARVDEEDEINYEDVKTAGGLAATLIVFIEEYDFVKT